MSRPAAPAEERVIPARLAAGHWDDASSAQVGEGDIHAAYSADSIATSGRIRTPFRFRGSLWTIVSIRHGQEPELEAYRLTPASAFTGRLTTNAERARTDGGDPARNDPLGFYHSVRVHAGGDLYALTGPAVRFLPGAPEPEQCDLFAGGVS